MNNGKMLFHGYAGLATAMLAAMLVMLVAVVDEGPSSGSGFPRNTSQTTPHCAPGTVYDECATERRDVFFESRGVAMHGWLYLPLNDAAARRKNKPRPIIVAAHGFCAQKDMAIPHMANAFASELDAAVLSFDYRGFGGSDGEPRNVWDPDRLVEDWMAALDFVGDNADTLGVDPSRMFLWGSSFSGGLVVKVAATYPKAHVLRGVVAQVPFVDGSDSFMMTVTPHLARWFAHLLVAGLKDALASFLGTGRYYINAVPSNPPESGFEMAFLATHESHEYFGMIPGHAEGRPAGMLGGWQPRVAASLLVPMMTWKPSAFADRVQVPALVVYSKNDSYQSEELLLAMVDRMPNAEVATFDGLTHYSAYVPPHIHQMVDKEIAFLRKHV